MNEDIRSLTQVPQVLPGVDVAGLVADGRHLGQSQGADQASYGKTVLVLQCCGPGGRERREAVDRGRPRPPR